MRVRNLLLGALLLASTATESVATMDEKSLMVESFLSDGGVSTD